MIEKIKDMVIMQQKLDAAIEKEHGLEYGKGKYTLEGLKLALIDELGEMNHELKGDWCWWKKTQKPVIREKALEELVDAWHFALSIEYHENNFNLNIDFVDYLRDCYSLSELISSVIFEDHEIIELMCAITITLGFTIDDVYDAYIKKNKVNFDRLKNGY